MSSPLPQHSTPEVKGTDYIALLWRGMTFADAGQLIKSLNHRHGSDADLDHLKVACERAAERGHYGLGILDLPQHRVSVFRAVFRKERKLLLRMFVIHFTDIHLSLLGALLSIAVLKQFEAGNDTGVWGRLFSGLFPGHWSSGARAGALAAAVLACNVGAAVLHAQKIEREMLVGNRVHARLVELLYAFLLRMGRRARQRHKTGDLVNLAQADAKDISELFAHALVDFPVLACSVAIITVAMYALVGPAAWWGITVVAVQLPLSAAFSRLTSMLYRELMVRSDKRLSLVTEWIQGMRLVRYFGWGTRFEEEIFAASRAEFRQNVKLTSSFSVAFSLSMTWWMFVCSVIFGGMLYFKGGFGAAEAFGALWLTSILGQQIMPLPWFVNIFSEARVGARRIRALLREPTQAEECGFSDTSSHGVDAWFSAAGNAEIRVRIKLTDVSVVFPDRSEPALSNISLSLEPGRLTSVVGAVGSGKSVLMQVISGDIPPTSGTVRIELESDAPGAARLSTPLHSASGLAALRRVLAWVPQETFVASSSVRENVLFRYLRGEPVEPPSDKDVVAALHAAALSDEALGLPGGLDAELGERGVNLSGGQRQRLSLSRSAFAARPLILLDDPMSAVDAQTEDTLAANLLDSRWARGHTVFWATHRLKYLSRAHEVVVLDAGKIVERGSYATLRDQSPPSRLATLLDLVKS